MKFLKLITISLALVFSNSALQAATPADTNSAKALKAEQTATNEQQGTEIDAKLRYLENSADELQLKLAAFGSWAG